MVLGPYAAPSVITCHRRPNARVGCDATFMFLCVLFRIISQLDKDGPCTAH